MFSSDGFLADIIENIDNWARKHIAGFITVIVFSLAAIIDIWLKLSGQLSISEYIWYITGLHPTLYSLGLFMTFGACYLVRDQWGLVMLLGYIGGHLFSGITYTASSLSQRVDHVLQSLKH